MVLNNIIQEERRQVKHSWEECISLGMEAREQEDQASWLLGDLAGDVEKDYGEDSLGKYAYAIGVQKKTLQGYRTIASTFPPETREKYRKLSFSHFKTLASLEKPEAWLIKADDHDWSVETLTKEIRDAYDDIKAPDLTEEEPRVFRCPECGLWRLEGVSSMEICKGHYTFKNGKIEYE